MGDRFYDFDAARAARRASPGPSMLVFGETVELPHAIPVALHLAVARLDGERLSTPVALELLALLVGQERVDQWTDPDLDLDLDDLIDLYSNARRIIAQRDTTTEPPDDPGEARAPDTGAQPGPPSSSTGGSSKLTSGGSTGST